MTQAAFQITTLSSQFVPSIHGFGFINAWEDSVFSLDVGGKPFTIALRGRCGGMAFAALDYYRIDVSAAAIGGSKLPDKRSALGRYTMKRQIESLAGGLGANMARFVAWTFRPLEGAHGAASLTRGRELETVLAALGDGNPIPIGLITSDRFAGMGLNHQVVACGAELGGDRVRIQLYDPNFPRRDDVWLEFSLAGVEPISETVAGKVRKEWRGMFVERYRPEIPPGVRRVHARDGESS